MKLLKLEQILKDAENAKLAKSAKFAKSAKDTEEDESTEEDQPTVDLLRSIEKIPANIYQRLPKMLEKSCSAFYEDERARDTFFIATMGILSGILPELKGYYHNDKVYANLFVFIVAPAASGKGVLKIARMLTHLIEQDLKISYETDKRDYEQKMHEYRRDLKRDIETQLPEAPVQKSLFVAANSSSAKIVDHLERNEGRGIIFETEADSMGGALAQDWGGYSFILRLAFHHERITKGRVSDLEEKTIEFPKLSVVLSGTPSQVSKIINSAEDGLNSRFLYYLFRQEGNWKDPRPKKGKVRYDEHLQSLQPFYKELYKFNKTYPATIQLNDESWDLLNEVFNRLTNKLQITYGGDAISMVYRLGLVTFRIAMIFSAFRRFEERNIGDEYEAKHQDVEVALELAEIFFEHNLLMYNNLPTTSKEHQFVKGNNKTNFFEALPDTFQRKEILELAEKHKISKRETDNILKNAVQKGFLQKEKPGFYYKNNIENKKSEQ